MAQINKPTDYFNTALWTGTGAARNITDFGHDTDWVWIKSRANTYNHRLVDRVRGATKSLYSDSTSAESTESAGVTGFITDGVSLGGDTGVNFSGNYVGWSWVAGGSASSNTDGSITSSVSANTTAGFSVVSYDSSRTPSASQTVGHGLGVTPDCIIIKNREETQNWFFWNKTMDANKHLWLNATDSLKTDAGSMDNTLPTSSVFGIGNFDTMNKSGDNIIAYCFAEKKGYSKFGKYRGNSNSDGVFVYLGFKPAFIMVKSDATEHWEILDNKRSTIFNPVDGVLFPNLSNAEETSNDICDFVSNGIKFRHSDGRHNSSSHDTYYMAFAENPLVGTNNIPATAR